MKSTLIANINNFRFEKNDDKFRNPPLHQMQKNWSGKTTNKFNKN
ncbi:hypothetical protein SIXOD_v1c28580 (plasmid) [Spiroplasma ixodetis Y32]|nr:hypothetical protein SIXOD_v1c28580 [Spiroplasma ixodetis Y32]